jgi:hypothetical protein
MSKLHCTLNYIFKIRNWTLHIREKKLGLSQQTQEMQLWGQHGESFDEAAVLNKSKHEIVVAVFAGSATGSFKG